MLALTCAAAAFTGCADAPTGSGDPGESVSLGFRVDVDKLDVHLIVVEVTAPDITNPLVFNFAIEDGVGSGSFEVPAGSNRNITITAFDADGEPTHSGSKTIDIEPGEDIMLSMTLLPLAGDVTIDVQLGSYIIVVTPGEVDLALGGMHMLTATITDPDGEDVEGDVAWATLDPGVATVEDDGMVLAIDEGVVEIVASFRGTSATARIRVVVVEGPPVASINVTPGATAVLEGQGYRLEATLRDDAGSEIVRPITWTSLSPEVAAVSPTGRVTGLSLGSAAITAMSEGHVAAASITVNITFASVAAGLQHSCGVSSAGNGYCWGNGNSGQLGNGSFDSQSSPTLVSGGLTFTAIAAADLHSCGLTDSGEIYCWGRGGVLGDGSTTNQLTPVPVAGSTDFVSLTAGGSHTCGVVESGAAFCWGSGGDGQLGNGLAVFQTTPVAVAGELTFASISAGSAHTCGVTTAGAGYCWGDGSRGQLGNGSTADQTTPSAVQGGLAFTSIGAGLQHTCGSTTTGAGNCWGEGDFGRLGNGSTSDHTVPVAVSGNLSFTSLAASQHSCGVTDSGAAHCWGSESAGELGNGLPIGPELTPSAVIGGLPFGSIAAGRDHTCSVTTAGIAYCWGNGSSGRLGTGSNFSVYEPTRVSGQP
jgi:alpha-tubulin suppressor-like RCC1 family protein